MTPVRHEPPHEGDERATLTAFLDFQRATLALKCDGLSDEQLREAAVPPSNLSLLGLVRHMAEVERNWFRPLLSGEEMSMIFAPGLDWDGAFRDVARASVAEAFDAWQAECEHARILVAAAPSLDVTGIRAGEQFSLRWVIAHLIEEYARHNGHADLIRERLDGSRGA
jgi:hypothetical protein